MPADTAATLFVVSGPVTQPLCAKPVRYKACATLADDAGIVAGGDCFNPSPETYSLVLTVGFDFFNPMTGWIPGWPLGDEVLDIEISLRAETLLMAMPVGKRTGCHHGRQDSDKPKQFF
jgi:hypothetical protein